MKIFKYRVQEKSKKSLYSNSYYVVFYPQWKFFLWPQWFYFNWDLEKTFTNDFYCIEGFISQQKAEEHLERCINYKK